ncbi:hypothetical protein EMCRGX_G010576 [Ephydatia muelleri]
MYNFMKVLDLGAKGKRMSHDPTGDSTDPDEEVGETGDAQQNLKALVQQTLEQMQGAQAPVPPAIRRRIKALKRLQLATTKLEAAFFAEVQELEAKYLLQYQPWLDKRSDIVNGKYEPTDEECVWENDEEDEEDQGTNSKAENETKAIESSGSASDKEIKGIPGFWLTTLRNVDLMGDLIEECDEPVLEHLTDIKVAYADTKGLDFSIEYYFSENDYFTNKVLTKSYTVSCDVNNEEPFSYEGAFITSGKGCTIDWKKGKNITVKIVKKKQKHKGGRGQTRTVQKTVPNRSFFNTFSLPDASKENDENDVALQLSDDFARAEFLRDRLIPKAVLFFTGEALEDDEDGPEFSGEEGEEDDDENGEGDDSFNPHEQVMKSKPPECKNQ